MAGEDDRPDGEKAEEEGRPQRRRSAALDERTPPEPTAEDVGAADVTLEAQQDAAAEGVEIETLDLAQREAAPRPPSIDTGTYNPSHDREQKRGRVALMLLWLLSAIVGGSFLLLLIGLLAIGLGADLEKFQGVVESMASVLQVLLTPIVGLVGAVTGFYFGEKSAAD